MAIEISSNTVVKILIRRGLESERTQTTLTEGELGYSIDTQRLFIGDGITPGGVITGNRFLGATGNIGAYSSSAQKGDTIFQTTNNVLYGYNGEDGPLFGWFNIHPLPYEGTLSNNNRSLEKAPANGYWRVSNELLGDGFALQYDGSVSPLYSLPGIKNRIDFDSRYLSLCADPIAPYTNSSFYFGNITQRGVDNTLEATVNVARSLYVNSEGSNSQIQLQSDDPIYVDAACINTLNADFNLKSAGNLSLFAKDQEAVRIVYNDTYNLLTTYLSSHNNGSLGAPNFDIRGVPVFRNDVFFDLNSNVTILGNLSVYGDTTYFETKVTTTSALSVINYNLNDVAMVVKQGNYVFGDQQTIARFEEGNTFGNTNPSILSIRENQFVGIGVLRSVDYTSFGANFVASASSLFRPNRGLNIQNNYSSDGYKGFVVDMRGGELVYNGDIEFYTAGNANILFSNTGGGITFDVGASTNSISISGNLKVSEDVIAFALSDINYKKNITPIVSALDKLEKINGVNFEWNDNSPYSGKDVGVIAQEVENVLPEIVTTRRNGAKAVRYEKLMPLIIEAIKELRRKT